MFNAQLPGPVMLTKNLIVLSAFDGGGFEGYGASFVSSMATDDNEMRVPFRWTQGCVLGISRLASGLRSG